ncbi:hypothetical protein CIG75_11620 [Tumebacillus algifaecis]|uniref:HTH cro/C1-type domain-containing protein n=1 Tax=Tumebacillus algifaecis TaxID=1214604 RepID=A0A223D1V4_9BACL|nr:helix-turn-helix domain-containing protein [Tumebacillus algifaecis]ASS75572.1 hypothetical protein CIG75_11620 [Tumebacillus algifaecis]
MEELGSELKRIREEKGYKLDDVQQATKIRTRYLEAIESGDLSALPGVVYARGFIKSYCDFLEIDGQELLEAHGMAADKADTQLEAVRVTHTDKNLGKASSFNTRLLPQVAIVVGILVVLTTVYAVWVNKDQQEVGKEPVTQSTEPPQGITQTPDTTVKPEGQETPEPPKPTTVVQQVQKENNLTTYQVTGAKDMTMELAALDDCWLEIKADGKVLESGIVKKGETRTWKANQSIALLTGKSKFITVKINEQQVQVEPLLRGYTFLFNLKS